MSVEMDRFVIAYMRADGLNSASFQGQLLRDFTDKELAGEMISPLSDDDPLYDLKAATEAMQYFRAHFNGRGSYREAYHVRIKREG